MSAADAIRDFVAPLLPGWKLQFGRWHDEGRAERYWVLQPAGGAPVELLREPQFTSKFIGLEGEDPGIAAAAADAVIEAMRQTSGALIYLQPAEPVFMPTSDGRPCFELAISAITD